jgi:hypothetical protein
LFSVSLEFLGDLTAGTFSEQLRQELTNHGIHLSQKATIQTLKANERWQITNGLQQYLVKRVEQSLNIYLESWIHFSCAFKAFICGMEKFIEDADKCIEWTEFGDSLYGGSYSSDPQIPYIYVFGKAPSSIYMQAFLEQGLDFEIKRKVRSQFTKDIAAILGRWLVEKNIPYASADYWEKQGLIQDGAFRSHYMNSLIFTTFCGMVTFSLCPDLDRDGVDEVDIETMKLVFKPTSQSILRCLEFSRMRWHHVLWLNRELDKLTQYIIREVETRGIFPYLRILMDLRSQAAIYLEDPLVYLWDASVGSEIARFLHTSIIEHLDRETIRKLEMVKQLINDRLDIVKTEDFIKSIGLETSVLVDS